MKKMKKFRALRALRVVTLCMLCAPLFTAAACGTKGELTLPPLEQNAAEDVDAAEGVEHGAAKQPKQPGQQ